LGETIELLGKTTTLKRLSQCSRDINTRGALEHN
jgi:hypothetical protein